MQLSMLGFSIPCYNVYYTWDTRATIGCEVSSALGILLSKTQVEPLYREMAFLLRKTSANLLMLLTIVPTFPLQLSLFLLVLCSAPLPVTEAAVIIFPVHDDTILYQDQDSSVTPIPVESHQKCWEECVGEGDDSDYCEGKDFSSVYESKYAGSTKVFP